MAETPHKAEKSVRKGNGQQAPREEAPRTSKVKFESFMPREEAVAYFEAIVTGLKKGRIQFKQGEATLALDPPAYLDISVKASRKEGREKIFFELGWRTDETSELTISSK